MAEPVNHCSTCGAGVPVGRLRCDTCGTSMRGSNQAVASRAGTAGRTPAVDLVESCPRCGYQGEGLPYFSRGRHVAALVGATALTAGAMGAGGLIYYVVRREHVICPRCGAGWGKEGHRAVARPLRSQPASTDLVNVGGEGARRTWSILFFVMATLLLLGGILGGAWEPIVVAAFSSGAGALLHISAQNRREERRKALIASLQQPVLKLAAENGGRLTVTHVAAEMGWTLPRAEKVLQSLDDGWRVSAEVTNEGVIVYEFRELFLSGEPIDASPELPKIDGTDG